MRNEIFAAFLSLFLALVEVFNVKDLEAPAHVASYYPRVKKHESYAMRAVPARPSF